MNENGTVPVEAGFLDFFEARKHARELSQEKVKNAQLAEQFRQLQHQYTQVKNRAWDYKRALEAREKELVTVKQQLLQAQSGDLDRVLNQTLDELEKAKAEAKAAQSEAEEWREKYLDCDNFDRRKVNNLYVVEEGDEEDGD